MPGGSDLVLTSELDAQLRILLKRIKAGGGGAGAEDFLDLTDTPDTYVGAGGYVVKVNALATGLEFVAGGAGVSSFVDLDDVPASYSGYGGYFVRVTDEEDGLEFAEVEDNPADRVIVAVEQTTHGFAVGDVIRATSADTYAKAQADTEEHAEVIGVVSVVDDADNFEYVAVGVYDYAAGVPVATVGTALYLSPSTAGLLTATEPTTVGVVSKPVAVMIVSDTKMVIFPLRGVVIGSGGSAHADNFLDLSDTPNSYEGAGYGLVRVNEEEDMLEFSLAHQSQAITPLIAEWPPPDWTDGELDGQDMNYFVGTWEAVTATGVEVDTVSDEKVISMTYAMGQRISHLHTSDGEFLERGWVFDGCLSFEFKTNLGASSSGYMNIALNTGWLFGIGIVSSNVRTGIFSNITAVPSWPGTSDWEAYEDFAPDSGATWHKVRISIRHPYIQLMLDDALFDPDYDLIYCYGGDIDNTNDFIKYMNLYSMVHNGGSGEYIYIKNLTLLNRDIQWQVGKPIPAES